MKWQIFLARTILFFFSYVTVSFCDDLYAQVNTELRTENPLSDGINKYFPQGRVNIFNIAAPADAANAATILQHESGQKKKLVFGENIVTNISLSSCKQIESGNKRMYKILLVSAGAKTLNIRLTNFYLSPNAQLYLYNQAGTVVMGPVSSVQNNNASVFISNIFPGDSLVLELTENATESKSRFTISRITYGIVDTYKGIFSNAPHSGACEQNVTCFLGAWHDEARSAVRLLINGNTLCSACLVNNTAQDGTPYVLTANHCVAGEADPEHDISFLFFFRSKYCDSSKPVNNYKVYNQCFVRAHYYRSDFALLEMAEKPSGDEKYFYAGWSRDTIQSGALAACLHFPQGDLMKYSESTLPIIDTAYGTTHNRKTMYWVRWTGRGVTEDGSSGGALFNSNKQLIGELYDGPSYCGAKGDNKSDFFGGFYASWNGGGLITNSLKDWLDPLHQNPVSINGQYITVPVTLQQSITMAKSKTKESK